MSFNIQELQSRAETRVFSEFRKADGSTVTAEEILNENNRVRLLESDKATAESFHIFLSHSSEDAKTVLGILEKLESYGYSVYIDWIKDSHMSRKHVTKKNIETLRGRMRKSSCLLFATTQHYYTSLWMPWELGFMDGEKDRAAILPLFSDPKSASNKYDGHEYLGSYPYCIEAPTAETKEDKLWICESGRVCKF